jgi:hypothetical protein
MAIVYKTFLFFNTRRCFFEIKRSVIQPFSHIQGGPIDKRISVSCIREFSLIRADFLRFLAVFCEILAHGFGNR